jgi:SNF2 family DNA or RNA helicase
MLDRLRGMGVAVHDHVGDSGYDYAGGTPFDVQRTTVELLTENHRAYVLSSMGTGKTKCVCWAYDYLRRVSSAHKMLVVCPLSTMRFTWQREIFMTIPGYKTAILHGSRLKRLTLLADTTVDIYIVNHDGLGIIADAVAKRDDIDVIVLDELATYRNRTGKTKVAEALCKSKPTVWGLTGAPTPNAPTDVWNQAKIITPTNVPKYFSAFRDATMVRINQFKWVPKIESTKMAMAALQPSVRFTLDDIMELPPFISRVIDVEMGPKQEKVYGMLRRDCQAQMAAGTIKAANAGAVMSKLLQVSLGWVYLEDGTTLSLDNDRRNKTLLDLIESTDRKVIVFAPFKHALAGIEKVLTRADISNSTVSGETGLSERDRIFKAFQFSDEPKVLIAHPQCVSHGITLTAADTIIWYAPITSLEQYDQANARIRRVGQKHKQQFLHMQATAVEKHIYNLLMRKLVVQDELLKMLEEESKR